MSSIVKNFNNPQRSLELSVTYIAMVPGIWKPDHSKFGHFCLDFKWFLIKWLPFVQISNDCASRYQIPFKIWTICDPTSFWPFKIQTSTDFRSHLSLVQFLPENRTNKKWFLDPYRKVIFFMASFFMAFIHHYTFTYCFNENQHHYEYNF